MSTTNLFGNRERNIDVGFDSLVNSIETLRNGALVPVAKRTRICASNVQ